MPYPSRSLSRWLSLSSIERCIPVKWKRSGCQSDSKPNDKLMVDSLLRLLDGFIERANLPEAFRTFSVIQRHACSSGFVVSVLRSASSLLSSCADLKLFLQGKQLHARIISLGLQQRPDLISSLANFYVELDLLSDAHAVIRNSDVLRPFPWNLLISSSVRKGFYAEAMSTYREMLGKGVRPDSFTYTCILKACGEEIDLKFGREVHRTIDDSPFGQNLYVQNALLAMYGRFGKVDFACKLFDLMPEKDAVSWNTMVSAYASKGMWKEAFELFESMWINGIGLNFVTWNTIAGGCLRVGNYRGALELISQIRTRGNRLDHVTLIVGLGACSNTGALKLGKEIHGCVIRSCYDGLVNVTNALITMYSRCRDLTHACMLFQSTEAKSVVTWNSMISGYCYMDRSEEASFLFREMLMSGAEPNHVTIASILPLCARVANLQHGKEFHGYITRRKCFEDHLLIWNALVDMYARSGKVLQAKMLFGVMKERDAVTYTSLIAGYGILGEGRVALRYFDEMMTSHIQPDHVTMVAVLSACSHSGLVVQGEELFKNMQRIYGITPRLEHYACMVDLYGRAGLLHKARDIIAGMPYRPTPTMWATLVGACRIHKNLDMGEWAAGKLLELRPEDSGYYVIVANMYAAAGRWDKLAMVRASMRDVGVRKSPGCAWLDVGSGFSTFLVEDASNPHAHEVCCVLEGLTDLMKGDGKVDLEDVERYVEIAGF